MFIGFVVWSGQGWSRGEGQTVVHHRLEGRRERGSFRTENTLQIRDNPRMSGVSFKASTRRAEGFAVESISVGEKRAARNPSRQGVRAMVDCGGPRPMPQEDITHDSPR